VLLVIQNLNVDGVFVLEDQPACAILVEFERQAKALGHARYQVVDHGFSPFRFDEATQHRSPHARG